MIGNVRVKTLCAECEKSEAVTCVKGVWLCGLCQPGIDQRRISEILGSEPVKMARTPTLCNGCLADTDVTRHTNGSLYCDWCWETLIRQPKPQTTPCFACFEECGPEIPLFRGEVYCRTCWRKQLGLPMPQPTAVVEMAALGRTGEGD